MKYIITERQHKIITEQNIPNSIKRRINKKTLEKFILKSETDNPPHCSEYDDGYDYADTVIDDAIDYFFYEFGGEIGEINEYGEIVEHLRTAYRDFFGKSLAYYFEDSCAEGEF
jgi:hypothetical protein